MRDNPINNLIFASIISADNNKYTEEKKQEVMDRYTQFKDKDELDWEFILKPIDTEGKLIKLFKQNDESGE